MKALLDKIQVWAQVVKPTWEALQDLLAVDGGLYVDAMCAAIIVRLIGPVWGLPAMNASEAGIWAATIGTFGYSKGKPKL